MRLFSFSVLVLAPILAFGQPAPDCESDDYFRGLRTGQTLTAPCDSMVVLTGRTYERLNIESAQRERMLELSDKARINLEGMIRTQEALLQKHELYIRNLELHTQELNDINQKLAANLEESIGLTREAVGIARKNKLLGIFVGGALGATAGLLVGGVVF